MTERDRLSLLLLTFFALATTACSDRPSDPQSPASDTKATGQTVVSTADQGQVADNRFVVVLDDGVEPGPAAGRIANRFGGEVLHVYGQALNGFALRVPDTGAQKLTEASGVDYVERDQEFRTFDQTLPTGIDRIEADRNSTAARWKCYECGRRHRDHRHRHRSRSSGSERPRVHRLHGGRTVQRLLHRRRGDDGNGHGTHVAGTAGALDNTRGVVGMVPGARLWAV